MPSHRNILGTSLVITGLIFFSSTAFCESYTVRMKSISFDPKTITIKAGDSVQWINKSLTDHSATSQEAEKSESKFDTGMIKPQKSSEKMIFKSAGTYLYDCKVHGKTMAGKISVAP